MRITLKLVFDADIDTVWDALSRPEQMRSAARPFIRVRSLEKSGFPSSWPAVTPHRVELSLFGLIPMGTQVVNVSYTIAPSGERTVTDSGSPTSGPLALLRDWQHRMTISAMDAHRTRYVDTVTARAGVLTPIMWITIWAMWRMRGVALRRNLRGVSR